MKLQVLVVCAISALLISESAVAAKCKFREDMDDFFSGALTLRTAWAKNSPIVSGVSESGSQWLEVRVSFSKSSRFLPAQDVLDSAFVVPQGAILEITLKDGTLVELTAMDPVKGRTNIVYPYEQGNNDYLTFVHAKIRYALTENASSALGAQDVAAVRVHADDKYHDKSLPKKGTKQFRNAVTCLQQGASK